MKHLIGIGLLLAGISISVVAQVFEQPVLISSAGQSADVKLVKLLADKEKLDATTLPMAGSEDLENAKTLVIVPGFSSKGLGAAGISQEEEMKRIQALINSALEKNIPIILIHIGGSARRQGQSDAFNALVAENAKHMIVVAQGNDDNFFSDIATEKQIPIEVVDKISDVAGPLGELFK